MEVRDYLHVDLWPLMAILQTEIKQASYIINSNVRAFRIIKEIMRNVSRLLYWFKTLQAIQHMEQLSIFCSLFNFTKAFFFV